MGEIHTGTVVRYCKPSTLDEQGNPTSSSFQLRKKKNEKELSVHLLDYFEIGSEKEKIAEVKKWQITKINYNFDNRGIFSTLDIEQSKNYIFQLISKEISYKELGLPHCGIYHDHDDLVISEYLSQCVKSSYSVNDV